MAIIKAAAKVTHGEASTCLWHILFPIYTAKTTNGDGEEKKGQK